VPVSSSCWPGHDFADTAIWVRINALNSPWVLDDLEQIIGAVGNQLDVIMIPKVEGPWDIHFVDQYVSLLEAKVLDQKTDPAACPARDGAGGDQRRSHLRRQPAHARPEPRAGRPRRFARHEDDPRWWWTPRAMAFSPTRRPADDQRAFFQQDLWHYTVARMVDAAVAHGLRSFYGPFGDLKDEAACEAQFRNAFLMGCSGAWSLAPNQIAIAKRVFSPDVKEVLFAKRILEAMPDGSGVATIDGKMQDDATWKQARVIVDLARLVARRDPELAVAYGL
jgi:malyl-CoA/(S)-citramalyl-CoA lyase